jgi:hypothetical protein
MRKAERARCYALLDEEGVAELDRLKSGYETASGTAALEPARAYVARATELCM